MSGRTVPVLVGFLLTAVVACGEDGTGDECLTVIPCVRDSDCNAGQHCNLALATPMCQVLYCGQDGSECSEDDLCADGNCDHEICVSDPDDYIVQCSDGMCLIPAGLFWMGCNSAVDSQCDSCESPYHEVTLSGYYMDRTEVTVDGYGECVTAGSCTAPSPGNYCGNYCNWGVSGRGGHPVNCVDWTQAGQYCAWAGKRLPTEAEWEKAARGTDGRKHPWGNETATCDYAVMDDGGYGCGAVSTWGVCGRSPAGDSPYGLCDMAGNVWEWVSDWYGSDYYTNSPASNPTGPDSGSCRVLRGGSFADYGDLLRASLRNGYFNPPYTCDDLGFRCARSQ